MEKKILCRRVSELNLSKLGLDPEIYELVKDENPAQLLHGVRNWDIDNLTKNVATRLKTKYGIKTKVTLSLKKQAEEIVWKLEERLLAEGFLRKNFHSHLLWKMHLLLWNAKAKKYDWEKEHFVTPKEQREIADICNSDIISYTKKIVANNEQYETLDFEAIETDLLEMLRKYLSKWQLDYFVNYWKESEYVAVVVFLTPEEENLEEAIVRNITYWAEKIKQFYVEHDLLTIF